MNQHAEQIRAAFESHEYLAPEAAPVYARAQELARIYRRRQRGVQAAGGAVLGAGLIAGAVTLPRVLPGGSAGTVVVQAPAAPVQTTAAQSPEEVQRSLDAYFTAGYGYADAVQLAKIWKVADDPGAVKAEAGRRLLAGERLPIMPHPTSTETGSMESTQPGSAESESVSAFFDAGYDYADAKRLARLWKSEDPYQAKVLAGQRLLDGKKLPIGP